VSLNLLAAFWAVSFLFVITPGMDWAYMISAGIRGRVVGAAALGLLTGHLAATLVVAQGLAGCWRATREHFPQLPWPERSTCSG
jgi:threonine/homoserine/homoserine lactone efflux protein